MSSVDTRVVEMQFDNQAFGKGVKDSLRDLDNLKQGLKLDGATSGLDKVGAAAKNFSMSNVESAVDKIASKFNALGAIGFTVLQDLTNSAINFGKNAFSSVLDPLIEGGKNRALNIEQAKFQFKGLGLDVDAVMSNALDAVKGTAYGLDAAAKVASQFGASGIKAGDQMTGALRGVAGMAAMTGSSFDDIGSIFTTVAGNGKLMSEQLYQFSSRGINAAAAMGKVMGKTETQVRAMITDGKIDFKTFAETMDKAFGAHAKDANQTYTGSLDNVHAALSRIGADFATAKFAGQRDIFNALAPAIDKVHTAIKPLSDLYGQLQASSSAGLVKFINGINFDGLTKAMPFVADSIKNIFTLISQFVNVFKGAFQEIFPPVAADTIVKIATAIDNFTKNILMTAGTMDKLKQTFAGVFAVVDIFFQLVKAGVKFLGDLFGHFATGQTNISGFTSKVGTLLIAFDKVIKQGDYFNRFFAKLEPLIEKPIDTLKKLVSGIIAFVKAIASAAPAASIIGKIHTALAGIGGTGGQVSDVMEKLKKAFQVVGQIGHEVFDGIGNGIKKVLDGVGNFIKGISFGDITKAAGLTGLIMLIAKFHKMFLEITVFLGKFKKTGTFIENSITRPMQKLTGTLVQMTKTLKATMLLEIAAAILILTVAISTLSKIPAVDLLKATTAIGVLMSQLVGSLTLLDRSLKKGGSVKIVAAGAALILFAGAVDLLASAAVKLGNLSWNDLAKGMTGVGVLLAAIVATLKLMPSQSKMVSSGIGILIIAEAIKVLVSAVKDMAALPWGELAKGLTGVAALLVSLALYTKFSKMSSIGDGAGIVLMAAAIKILASAMKDIAKLSWNDIAKGLTTVAVGLLAMAGAMKLLPEKGSFTGGLALLELSASLLILAQAMTQIANLSWNDIAQGLIGIAGGLTAMVVALKLMPAGKDAKNFVSGAALLEVAAAVKILGSAISDVGQLDWNQVAKGVTGLATGLGAIAVALKLLPPGNLKNAASILIVSAALKVLASAMTDLGGMSWNEVAKSLVALAGALLIIGVALTEMDATVTGALALVGAAFAIKMLAGAMQSLGAMSWSDMAVALVGLAGAFLILAVGLTAMDGTLPGALGLLAATPGIAALGKAMTSLGGMSWSDLAVALVAMAGALVILAVGLTAMVVALPGAAALAVAAPALGELASAMQKAGKMSWSDIAAGTVAIGGALVALAVGLTAMVVALPGAAALAVAAPALGNLADAMKKIGAMSWSDIAAAGVAIGAFLTSMAVGLVAMTAGLGGAGVLALVAPALKTFIAAAKNSDGIGDHVKSIANALKELAKVDNASLNNVATAADKLAKAIPGLNTALTQGMSGNVQVILQAGAAAATSFAKGVTDNTGPATNAGVTLIDKLKDGINQATQAIASQVSGNATGIGKNIVDGVNRGVDNNQASLMKKMQAMATAALNAAKTALGIHSPSKKFQEIGDYVVQGFALGLAGHPEKVESAVDSLVDTLTGKFDDAMQANLDDIASHQDKIGSIQDQIQQNAGDIAAAQADLNDAINTPIKKSTAKKLADRRAADAAATVARNNKIRDAQKRLDDLIYKQNQYNQSIAEEQAAINQDSDEYWRLNAARATLINQLAAEQAQLNTLIDARDANNQAIEDEQQILDSATQARDDYNQSLRDQYGAQEDISKETKLSDYVKDLQDQIVATQQFTIALQELRSRGLNDELYKSLLAKGPTEAMPFVQQLLEGGQEAVDNLNYLGTSLDEAAGSLGDQASTALYQAGVDAANGILQGLQSKATDIQAQMDAIAQYMVTALNNALGIHSPSRVMAVIGSYAAQGIVKGLSDSASLIEDASAAAGQSAIDGMKKTISGLGALVTENMDVNPTITPVLDLSAIQKDASSITDLLSVPQLAVGSVSAKASDAAAGYAANQAALLEALTPAEPPAPVVFNQTNNSPKALSSAEIYRNTNNQISVAKGALTTSARKS